MSSTNLLKKTETIKQNQNLTIIATLREEEARLQVDVVRIVAAYGEGIQTERQSLEVAKI